MIMYPFGFRLFKSENAVIQDGNKIITVKRTWRERFFSPPFNFWIKEKKIEVPNYVPQMYRMFNIIIYHPSLEGHILKLVSSGEFPPEGLEPVSLELIKNL